MYYSYSMEAKLEEIKSLRKEIVCEEKALVEHYNNQMESLAHFKQSLKIVPGPGVT